METNAAPGADIKFRKHVTPKAAVTQIQEPCLFTISVGAAKQNIDDLVAAYLWGRERYNVGAILLGDGLYRITLKICSGLSDCEARDLSIATGIDIQERFLQEACLPGMEVFKTSDIFLQHDFIEAQQRISHLYHSQSLFHDSMIEDATTFVDRQQKNGTLKIARNEAIKLSTLYLTQEIAVYLVMAERGWLTEIYFGHEIPTLAKIMNNEIPDAPKALKQRVNIGLEKVRKRRTPSGQAQIMLRAA
jgi:tRNA-dependent cyclodipeptide synthase